MTMGNIRPRLVLLIGVAAILAAVVLWRLVWGGSGRGGEVDQAVRRITKLADKGDTDGLAREAAGSNEEVACIAVRAMGRVGPRAIPNIERALQDERPRVRETAATAVSRAGDEKHTPVLAAVAAKDKSPHVRAAAVRSLGHMRAYNEMETLLTALADKDEIVRRRANAAIEKIIGAGVSFNATVPPEEPKQKQAVDELRAMWRKMKDKTETFYKRRRQKKKTR